MYELRRAKRGIGEHSREMVLEADEKDPTRRVSRLEYFVFILIFHENFKTREIHTLMFDNWTA